MDLFRHNQRQCNERPLYILSKKKLVWQYLNLINGYYDLFTELINQISIVVLKFAKMFFRVFYEHSNCLSCTLRDVHFKLELYN